MDITSTDTWQEVLSQKLTCPTIYDDNFKMLMQAADFENKGRYIDSLACWKILLDRNSEERLALISSAGIFQKLGYHDETITLAKKALTITSHQDNVVAHEMIGDSLFAKSLYREALIEFKKTKEIYEFRYNQSATPYLLEKIKDTEAIIATLPEIIVQESIPKDISTKIIKERVPDWIKNNARWWSAGQIDDSAFTSGIQFMIKEKIINIPDLPAQASATAKEAVPDWVKNNAKWWADGLIGDDDFVNGIKYLVEKGIINVI